MKKIRYIIILLILFTATFAQIDALIPNTIKNEIKSEISNNSSSSKDNIDSEIENHLDNSLITPLATITTFRINFKNKEHPKELLKTMNLEFINSRIRHAQGIRLAEMLNIGLNSIPNLDSIAAIETNSTLLVLKKFKAGHIALHKNNHNNWKFSSETMLNIENIFNEIIISGENFNISNNSSMSLKIATSLSKINPTFNKTTLLLQNWQWMLIFILILIGAIIQGLSTLYTHKLIAKFLWKRLLGNSHLREDIGKPIGLVLATFFWQKSLILVSLSAHAELILLVALKIILSASVIWALWRLSDWFCDNLAVLALKTESRFDDLLVPMLRTSFRIFIVCIGLLIIADALDLPIYTILSGLTIGSFALALAAKDTVENLFGSVTVLLDRPFDIGDWVVIGDLEGSVEKLGFRSTKIRTFYNSLINVPNANLIKASIDNMGRRVYRRINTKLSIAYDTPPEKIQLFTEGIKTLIDNHPYTRKDYYHVYLNGFNASSLDILLYCFVKTPDWSIELREKERLFLDIIKLAKKINVEFAFPTQTLHLHQENPQDIKENSWSTEDIQKFSHNLSQQHFENGQKPGMVKFPNA